MPVKLTSLKLNPENPRYVRDHRLASLAQSIKKFPEMMALRPIIIDEKKMILAGEQRYRACKLNGMKEIPDAWVLQAKDLTPAQKKEFIVKDNDHAGEWNMDNLANNWDAEDLTEWGLMIPGFNTEDTTNRKNAKKEPDPLTPDADQRLSVVIYCEDVEQQQDLLVRLIAEGLNAKTVTI